MDKVFVEDLQLAIKNKSAGIEDYLNTLGKLWVTPYGPFNTLNEVEKLTGLHRKSLLRKFYSKREKFAGWYIIQGDTELTPSEDCEYCDALDDELFAEGCWLCTVFHEHGKPFTDDVKFVYLYQGLKYESTIKDWNNGVKYHLLLESE